MSEAEILISSAIAELTRAEGLFRGALTETKKALLLRRLGVARTQLSKGYVALLIQRTDDDPLPNPPTPAHPGESRDPAPRLRLVEP